MRLRPSVTILFLLFLIGSGFAQSLGELARKEKERRAKTKGPVRVIDDRALSVGRPADESTSAESPAPESQAPEPPSAPSPAQTAGRLSPASGKSSSNTLGDRRRGCDEALRKAEAEKARQKARFDEGVAQVATIDTTKPGLENPNWKGGRRAGPYTYVPGGGGTGGSGARVNVEGTRVSCAVALGDPSGYPQESRKCGEIKLRIEAADVEIERALDCLRRR